MKIIDDWACGGQGANDRETLMSRARAGRKVLFWLRSWYLDSRDLPDEATEEAIVRFLLSAPEGTLRAILDCLSLTRWSLPVRLQQWLHGLVTSRLPATMWVRLEIVSFWRYLCGYPQACVLDRYGGIVKEAHEAAPQVFEAANLEFFAACLDITAAAISYFPRELMAQHKATVVAALRAYEELQPMPWCFLERVPTEWREDRDFVLQVLMYIDDSGTSYALLPEGLKEDFEVAMAFVESSGDRWPLLPEALKSNVALLEVALITGWREMDRLPEPLRSHPGLLAVAAGHGGPAFFTGTDVGRRHSDDEDLALCLLYTSDAADE